MSRLLGKCFGTLFRNIQLYKPRDNPLISRVSYSIGWSTHSLWLFRYNLVELYAQVSTPPKIRQNACKCFIQ